MCWSCATRNTGRRISCSAVQLWGELQPHDKKEMHVPGFPQMYYVSNEQTVPGKRYISGETFHTDHSNHPAPPKATILYPVSLPSQGGDTQYVNMHLAYDDLPEAMKRRIDPLKAVHVYLSKYSPRELKPLERGKPQGPAAAGRPPAGAGPPREPTGRPSSSTRCGSNRSSACPTTRRSTSSPN